MNFVKVANGYIDLCKVLTVEFIDEDIEINFICQGLDDNIFLKFDNEDYYFMEKQFLIKNLIERSDCNC